MSQIGNLLDERDALKRRLQQCLIERDSLRVDAQGLRAECDRLRAQDMLHLKESLKAVRARISELEQALVFARVALSGEPAPATLNGEPSELEFVSADAAVMRIDVALTGKVTP